MGRFLATHFQQRYSCTRLNFAKKTLVEIQAQLPPSLQQSYNFLFGGIFYLWNIDKTAPLFPLRFSIFVLKIMVASVVNESAKPFYTKSSVCLPKISLMSVPTSNFVNLNFSDFSLIFSLISISPSKCINFDNVKSPGILLL